MRRNRCTEPLAVRLQVGCLGWLRVKPYFWVSMEHLPADARTAPSASAPNDTVMDNLESPKRPREAPQGNM
eukprot:scaffold24516_cov107-Isochrysis_galbana.AAC.1